MTPTQRLEAEQQLAVLDDALSPAGTDGNKARSVILAKMIFGLAGAALSETSASAKAELYRDATDDLPPWALAEALRDWVRGNCGEQNYAFPPAPAVLRQITERIMRPYLEARERCQTALDCVSIDRAMDQEPLPRRSFLPRLKSV